MYWVSQRSGSPRASSRLLVSWTRVCPPLGLEIKLYYLHLPRVTSRNVVSWVDVLCPQHHAAEGMQMSFGTVSPSLSKYRCVHIYGRTRAKIEIYNLESQGAMDHRAVAWSLLAIAAKLPSLNAAKQTQKARWSLIGRSNPRSV